MARSKHIESMFGHVAWADERALLALEASQGQPVRALALFNHVLGAEAEWLARLEQRPCDVAIWPSFDLAQCRVIAARNREQYAAYLSHLSPTDLDRHIRYRNSRGAEFESRIEDILIHVALHGAYHRGQVALLVRDAGEEPNATDYVAFVRGAPAATRVGQPVG
ncbi:MAG TPA: DinB family protein [Gemmatimonadaceae bacterium]|nr:DinB family protein [Gemmatimonadaceae bacterium]